MTVYTDGLAGMKARSLRVERAMDAGKRVRLGGSVTFEGAEAMARVFTAGRLEVCGALKGRPVAVSVLAERLRRDERAVARDVKMLERYGLVRTGLTGVTGGGEVRMVEVMVSELRFVGAV